MSRLKCWRAGAASETGRGKKTQEASKPSGGGANGHQGVTDACHAVFIAVTDAVFPCCVLSVASLACQFPSAKKVASCSVMTTDLTSVTVPPRKGETGRKNRHSSLRSKSWEGESPAAR